MAALRIPSIRYLATCPLRHARGLTQRRWAQVHDVRFLATTQPPRAILDKYREKLEQKARQEGLGSVDDLKAAYADKIGEQRRKDGVSDPLTAALLQTSDAEVKQPSHQSPAPDSQAQTPPANPASSKKNEAGIKTLDEIIDLEKTRALPEHELTTVWRLRHASSPRLLSAVIPARTYQTMEAAARASPQFVLPVPRLNQGAEMHFLQWTFDAASRTTTVLFTQLAEYKARGEFAQPHTTVTHHLDLVGDRGLVLMQGQVGDERGMQPEQARWLVMCLQRFYGGWDGVEAGLEGERAERAAERRRLLQWFSVGDPRFTVEKLIEEAERMG